MSSSERRHVAEPFLQARPVVAAAREHEAAIALHPRHLQHRELRILGIEVLRIAVIERHGLEPAVEMIGPAVIAAGEFRRVALVGRHHHGAAVGALVADHAYRSVGVAHHHHRLASDLGGEIVARIFDLALVPDIDPGGIEDPLHLQFEDGRIGVELAGARGPARPIAKARRRWRWSSCRSHDAVDPAVRP